jgi:hypothetical protein
MSDGGRLRVAVTCLAKRCRMRMTRSWGLLVIALGAGAVFACRASGGEDETAPADPALGSAAPASEDGINTTGEGAGTGASTGLPCDVQQLFENRCVACHLGPPGAVRLLTYDDVTKPSVTDPNKSLALVALERMKSTTSPMPPPPVEAPTAEEIATLETWIKGGMPRAEACTPPVAPDGGAGAAIYNTPSVCTSKTYYRGEKESETMRPGEACITCHTRQEGPSFSVAGTVYPTAHEPNDCNGVPGGVTVVISDKNGRQLAALPVNGVGNFMTRERIKAPFHVKLVRGNAQRAMAALVTAGDCNSCHTEKGVNGAPGRLMAP